MKPIQAARRGAKAALVLVALGLAACSSPVPPLEVTLTADAESLRAGESTVLRWRVLGAQRVTITSGAVSVVESSTGGDAPFEGSQPVGPLDRDSTYVLTASDSKGATATAEVTVRVAQPLAITRFEASPNPGPLNGRTVLSWDTRGADRIRISSGGDELLASTSSVQGGSLEVDLVGATTRFRLEAFQGAERVEQLLAVSAEPLAEVVTFTAAPALFMGAEVDVALAWSVRNATAVNLLANGVKIATFPGVATVSISQTVRDTTVFELEAVSGAGVAKRAARVAKADVEQEANDTPATARSLQAAVFARIGADTDVDYYRVTVPPGGSLLAETSDGRGGCAMDTLLVLYAPDGTTLLGSDDDGGKTVDGSIYGCSKVDPRTASYARNLAGGTYYLAVRGVEGELGDYVLTVEARLPMCGNGILEPGLGEQCDDGNLSTGDGCNASCLFEGPSEVEPNEQAAKATAVGANRMIRGSLASATDVDVYAVAVPEGYHLDAHLTLDGFTRCTSPGLPRLALLDVDGTTELDYNDYSGPDSGCGRISPANASGAFEMKAGTYFLAVSTESGLPIPSYYLHVRLIPPGCRNGVLEADEQCDDANSVAGDGCDAACKIEISEVVSAPGAEVPLVLGPPPAFKVIQIDIETAGQSIAVRTSDGQGSCAVDTALTLYTADLSYLGISFSGGDLGCANLTFPSTPFAQDLAPGTYYLVIENEGTTGGDVSVEVEVIDPACGNGALELLASAPEACDDGNLVAGDGCDASCRFEPSVIREVEPNDLTSNAKATGVLIGAKVRVAGALPTYDDEDVYSFDVPVGKTATLLATTYSRLGDTSICYDDTVLELLNAAGTVIESNDDPEEGLCARIDGTQAEWPGATMLAAGRYYLRVKAFGTVRQYLLDVELR